MEKELPGSPPPNEPIKPKAPNTTALIFSFDEMQFDGSFTHEEDKFVRFFIDKGKDSFFIEMLIYEYFDFFEVLTDLYEEAENNDVCTCSECIVENYEEIDEVNQTIIGINANTNEKTVIEEVYKMYLVYNLASSINMSIHGTHILKEPIKD